MPDIYFVTNRKFNSKKKFHFDEGWDGSKSPFELRFGTAAFAGGKLASVVVEQEKTNAAGVSVPTSSLASKLQGEMIAGRDLVFYVHGFNNSFQESLEAAQSIFSTMVQAWPKPPVVAVFSWPSFDSPLKYLDDRAQAATNGAALSRVLGGAAEFLFNLQRNQLCNQRIHVLCHSMGNYVLRYAVQSGIKNQDSRFGITRMFDQVVLAAADEDADALEMDFKLRPLASLSRRVVVYFNADDTALTLSDQAKFNPPRLGHTGVETPEATAANVASVDCSFYGFLNQDGGHGYFLNDPAVRQHIGLVLQGASLSDATATVTSRPPAQTERLGGRLHIL